eukprot:TRINITY_DN3938_c0_g1_i1.p1 TRINITY_DN3938_c0_g1~~TRINITY_DN3938_c0_g1_i1.p1  ORF type:complete len:402 (-),score=37.01 TRINITY_DN3938_c0_g1_i1:26-1231(-)
MKRKELWGDGRFHSFTVTCSHYQCCDALASLNAKEYVVVSDEHVAHYDICANKMRILFPEPKRWYQLTSVAVPQIFCVSAVYPYVLACGLNIFYVYDYTTGQYYSCTELKGMNNCITVVQTSPSNIHVLVGSNSGFIAPFALKDRTLIPGNQISFPAAVNYLAFSHTATQLVVIGDTDSVFLFDVSLSKSQEIVLTKSSHRFKSHCSRKRKKSKGKNNRKRQGMYPQYCDWNRDDSVFAVSNEQGSVKWWSSETGQKLGSMVLDEAVYGLKFGWNSIMERENLAFVSRRHAYVVQLDQHTGKAVFRQKIDVSKYQGICGLAVGDKLVLACKKGLIEFNPTGMKSLKRLCIQTLQDQHNEKYCNKDTLINRLPPELYHELFLAHNKSWIQEPKKSSGWGWYW